MRSGVLLGLLCAACASQPISYAPEPNQEELFNARWVGHSEDDLIVQYGKPTDVLPLSNGHYVDSYHSEITSTVARGRGAASGTFAGNRYDASTTTVYCDRRFEIDKATHTVVRAVITGSSCDYDR